MASIDWLDEEHKQCSIRVSAGYKRDENGKRIKNRFPRVPYTPKGRTKREREIDAEIYAKQTEERLKNGAPIDDKTFSEVVEEWHNADIDRLEIKTHEQYMDYLRKYAIPRFGPRKIQTIKVNELQQFLDDLKNIKTKRKGQEVYISRKTVVEIFTSTRTIFRFALSRYYIDSNPCIGVVYPPKKAKGEKGAEPQNRTAKKTPTWTPAEARIFLRGLDFPFTRHTKGHYRTIKSTGNKYWVDEFTETTYVSYMDRLFFWLAFMTGARESELCALNFGDFDDVNYTVKIDTATSITKSKGVILKGTKTAASERMITVPHFIIEMVNEWERQLISIAISDKEWQGEDPLFFEEQPVFVQINEHGKRVYPSTWGKKFKSYQFKIHYAYMLGQFDAGLPVEYNIPVISIHGIRHSVITALKNANRFDPGLIQKRVGHEGDNVTDAVYTHMLQRTDIEMAHYLQDIYQVYATEHSTIYGPTEDERRFPVIVNLHEAAERKAREVYEQERLRLQAEAERKGKEQVRIAKYRRIIHDAVRYDVDIEPIDTATLIAASDEDFDRILTRLEAEVRSKIMRPTS